MRTVALLTGVRPPSLGVGTWRLGESPSDRARDVAAVRRAFELGYRLIDTAEMYGDGGAERVVGEALRAAIGDGTVRRQDVFIVTKVLPANASRRGVVAAASIALTDRDLAAVDARFPPPRRKQPLAMTQGLSQSAARDTRTVTCIPSTSRFP